MAFLLPIAPVIYSHRCLLYTPFLSSPSSFLASFLFFLSSFFFLLPSSFSFFLRYVFDDFNIALETCEDLILAQHAADLKTEITVVCTKIRFTCM